MAKKEEVERQVEILRQLMENKLTTPNDLTIGMGELIRNAREDQGVSQSDLANQLHRRQATISDIENGKSEIGIYILLQLAIALRKPISYFFPKSLLKDQIVDIKTPFESKMLNYSRIIEHYGNTKFVEDLLQLVTGYFEEEAENPFGYGGDVEE